MNTKTMVRVENGHATELNPATKLPHTPAYLARINPALARIAADLEHCRAKAKTRKRSVAALMAEKGYTRDPQWNDPEAARALLASLV